MGILQNVRDYQPSKAAVAWAAAGAGALTMVIGFTWGGWVTGGTAERMVQEARAGAQAEVAAAVCAENFRAAPTAQAQQAQLAGLSLTRQRQFVLDQPWAQVPGLDSLSRTAAELCARKITQMDPDELGLQEAAT